MPSEDNKLLECVIEKIDVCKNNLENSSKAKVSEHISSSFSMSIISPFRSMKNKHLSIENNLYRGKYCMKKFFESSSR